VFGRLFTVWVHRGIYVEYTPHGGGLRQSRALPGPKGRA
jgi:hypothetical protein